MDKQIYSVNKQQLDFLREILSTDHWNEIYLNGPMFENLCKFSLSGKQAEEILDQLTFLLNL